MHGKADDDDEQSAHHDFDHALHALLKPERAHAEASEGGDKRPEKHDARTGKQIGKDSRHLIHGNGKRARHGGPAVIHHPSGHGNVEHHERVGAYDAEAAEIAPFGTGLEFTKGAGHVSPGSAPDGEFHDENGQPHAEKKHKIGDKKNSAAVFARNKRKTPYIAESDGTTGGKEKKTQPTGELFSLSHSIFLLGGNLFSSYM